MNEATPIQFFHAPRMEVINISAGIYFGMPEDIYHAIPALSSTGMKNILVSPPDFYFNCPWLNPFYDEDREDEDGTEWRKFGRASHSRILEGKSVFDTLYCVEFIAPEDCLDTIADMKAYCVQNGIDTAGSSKWKKPEWIDCIKFSSPNALIYEIEKEKYYRETGGKIQLSQKQMRRIEIAAAMIEKHPDLKDCFKGGYPEVSVVWFENGLWFKCRFDYLKPRAIVDLKTFTNMKNKPLDGPHGGILYEIMASLKYHIQVGHYVNGARHAADFARKGMVTTYGSRFTPSVDFLRGLGTATEDDEHQFYFVFQKKGGAPLARGKRFKPDLGMMVCANASIQKAIELFKDYSERYGTGVWVDETPITPFEDHLFPAYALEM